MPRVMEQSNPCARRCNATRDQRQGDGIDTIVISIIQADWSGGFSS